MQLGGEPSPSRLPQKNIWRRLTPTYPAAVSCHLIIFARKIREAATHMCRLPGARRILPFHTALRVCSCISVGHDLLANVVVPFSCHCFDLKQRTFLDWWKNSWSSPATRFAAGSTCENHVGELPEARVIWSSGALPARKIKAANHLSYQTL
jgi:hypothetical protein